jgi:hypothetical protein
MAASSQIGSLHVAMAIDTAQFMAGVKSVQGTLGTLGKAFKAFAASAAVNFLGQMGVAALRSGAQIGDLAETIGITAEQVQVFNRLAVASGSSSESMAKGLQSIAEQSVDAESKLSKLFAANGIQANGMAVNEVIRTFTDLLKNARNPAAQLAIATEVLGTRVGRDLIEALREGAGGYDRAMQEMIAAGELMSNAEIERLQELETQYNVVTDRIGAYWMKMVVGIADSTAGLGSQFMGFRESVQQSIWGTTDAQMGPRTSGPGSIGGPNEFATPSNPVPVKVTNMPAPDKKASTGKSASAPSWLKGSSENPMQEGPITGYDLRGPGLELSYQFEEAQASAVDLAASITDTLGAAISGLASGTMSFKDAFSSMASSLMSDLSDITSQLLKSGLMSLLGNFGGSFGAQGLGGFGGFYAEGGTLGAGKWGIAGENGPEIIKGPASISPMGGGGMTVNVINQGGGQVEQQKRRGSNGEQILDVIVRGIARDETMKTNRRTLPGMYATPAALTQR